MSLFLLLLSLTTAFGSIEDLMTKSRVIYDAAGAVRVRLTDVGEEAGWGREAGGRSKSEGEQIEGDG